MMERLRCLRRRLIVTNGMKRLATIAGLAALLLSGSAQAATTFLSPWPKAHFEDNNGNPCSGCLLFTYAAGTTTKQATYTDSTGATPNVNPVVLNTRGEANIWLSPNLSYKYVLSPSTDTDPPTNPFWTVDNISSLSFNISSTTTTCSSLNSLYFSSFSQLAANCLKLALSGSVSDTTGSFRDTLYVENTDTDTTTYTSEHVNYAGRFAAFGKYASGWVLMDKNIGAVNAYAQAATSGVGQPVTPPGVAAFTGDSFQWGGGIGDNEFAAHNPSAASGSIAQASSLAGVQAIVDADYADDDTSHTAYGVLASNIGTNRITAAYGYSGTGTQRAFIQANGAGVTEAAIVMPHSTTTNAGSVIDYGRWNGNPAGGSYTSWLSGTSGGRYAWTDNGSTIMTVDLLMFELGGATSAPVHLAAAQQTPPALSSCGTSPGITGSDVGGTVTMGTGTPTGCTITFNVAYVSTPACTVTWRGTPLATQSYTVSAAAITLTQTATSSNKVDYTCVAQGGG